MSKVFLDTNILVYSLDQANPEKRICCRRLMKSLSTDNNHGQIVRGVRIENPLKTLST